MSLTLWSRRSLLCRVGACMTVAVGSGIGMAAAAQRSPSRLRILCGSPPGGTPDVVARIYADVLGGAYPGGVIIDNRPGAAAQIAVAALKQSRPDGTTMLLVHGAVVTMYPSLYTKLAYDPAIDLSPVSLAGDTAFGLAIGPAVPEDVRQLDAFIAWARTHPSACTFGSPGLGTMPHLLGEMLFRQAGLDAQHVAYSSGPMAIGDVLGGRLAAVILPEGLLRPYHAAARIRVVATSLEKRSRFMPDVATLAEQGRHGLFAREWFGFFMPGSTPAMTVEDMSQAIQAAARSPRTIAALDELAIEAKAASPALMSRRIDTERRQWQEPIARLGLRLD